MHLEEQHNKDLIQSEELKPTNTELTGSIPPQAPFEVTGLEVSGFAIKRKGAFK